MSRTIKFRVWLKHKGEMIYDINDSAMPRLYADGRLRLEYDSVDVTDDVILEEFTGLQDINGVDIYEGDIVETIEVRGDNTEEDTAIIKMDGYMWMAMQKKHCDSYLCCYAPNPYNESEIKVIGNIHTNKKETP